ncbi:hypothetical protein NSQ91_30435 [Paenibacillus sp. FSL R7-0048]|jgi:uncharacterized membrane protein|uniref:Uncharacterized protein n=1 Tax=Paenibacillus odorifer TaxID=189426 RepID=A0A1R0X7Z5_9BACL|nr:MULTISPECIES: hypothetical protein [Paenibacillus]AWV36240.1 hypothetical protein CD191_28570 [Paenibacillus odorifer]MDH6428818.1 putative membrane protein [Paenibacillus sp. PastH-4]MDH6445020.1 putative membrane protein [Paenibacillus sp. PastF-4]MDH6528913.1 putative membrane protein [Paenibacillus sp. PastH-3]OMC65763.1 hypothetical protein BK121_21045 [Paenibacillus odorifer]
MHVLSSSELAVTAIFALILAVIAYLIIRNIPKMVGDIAAFRKRTLVWTQVSLVLTVLQLNFKAGDWRFSIVLGLIVLFTGAIWLSARYYDISRNAGPESKDPEVH